MTAVANNEEDARLLFCPQMIADGKLKPVAFPTEELMALSGKNGCSVDRIIFFSPQDYKKILKEKAIKIGDPEKKRTPCGFCIATVGNIRQIKFADNCDSVLDVLPDPINNKNSPMPWDDAHAVIRRRQKSFMRSRIRGVRDKLIATFSDNIVSFMNIS